MQARTHSSMHYSTLYALCWSHSTRAGRFNCSLFYLAFQVFFCNSIFVTLFWFSCFCCRSFVVRRQPPNLSDGAFWLPRVLGDIFYYISLRQKKTLVPFYRVFCVSNVLWGWAWARLRMIPATSWDMLPSCSLCRSVEPPNKVTHDGLSSV